MIINAKLRKSLGSFKCFIPESLSIGEFEGSVNKKTSVHSGQLKNNRHIDVTYAYYRKQYHIFADTSKIIVSNHPNGFDISYG